MRESSIYVCMGIIFPYSLRATRKIMHKVARLSAPFECKSTCTHLNSFGEIFQSFSRVRSRTRKSGRRVPDTSHRNYRHALQQEAS